MSFDSYGLSQDTFKTLFLIETQRLTELFLAMQLEAEKKGLKFDQYDNQLLWNFFQEVGCHAEDAARIYQKKHSPETMREHSYDFGLTPSRDEMFDAIQSLHAKLESLCDYIGRLTENLNT